MDINILEEAASGKIRERTHEEAERFMARIRANLFDLLCHSDEVRAEMPAEINLDEYGGREAVERAIGKAIVNLLALGAVFGVRTADVITRELGLLPDSCKSAREVEKPNGNGASPHTQATGIEDAGQGHEKAGDAGKEGESAATKETGEGKGDNAQDYRRRLDEACSADERAAVWKEIQIDRVLDSKTRAALYRHMKALDKKDSTKGISK
jgi:hypothetical protein